MRYQFEALSVSLSKTNMLSRFVLLVVGCLFFLQSAPALASSSSLLLWGARNMSTPAAKSAGALLITDRCYRSFASGLVSMPWYGPHLSKNREISDLCYRASLRAFETIDPMFSVEKRGLMFFKSRFAKWYQWPQLNNYLHEILKNISWLQVGRIDRFSMYDFTVGFMKKSGFNSEDAVFKTNEILAVLFQDNERLLHIPFLETTSPFSESLEVSRAIAQIQKLISNQEESRTSFSQINYFPERIENQRSLFTGRSYYFWIPAFLVHDVELELKRQSKGSDQLIKEIARAVVFQICLTFKYGHIYNSAPKAVLRDPTPTTDRHDIENTYRDLYFAVLGIAEATGAESLMSWTFSSFRNDLRTAPWKASRTVRSGQQTTP